MVSDLLRHKEFPVSVWRNCLPGNNAAWDAVAAAVGPCLDCWIRIAQHLTLFAADEMRENMGHDNALEYIQVLIAESLDAAERHEHDG